MNTKLKLNLSKQVKKLRQERRWTQAALAKVLDLSQNRLSEIESGKGSFTAEQLILILQTFNVPLDYFVETKADEEDNLQNALIQLGSSHLRENSNIPPTVRIRNVVSLIKEVVATAESPRLITAVAPVLVNHSTPAILNTLGYQLHDLGLTCRYGWILENTLKAILSILKKNQRIPIEVLEKYNRFTAVLEQYLSAPGNAKAPDQHKPDTWAIDAGINSKETIAEVKKVSSSISKKWGIISRIQPEDFERALSEANA